MTFASAALTPDQRPIEFADTFASAQNSAKLSTIVLLIVDKQIKPCHAGLKA
jgi:hypothetical protein